MIDGIVILRPQLHGTPSTSILRDTADICVVYKRDDHSAHRLSEFVMVQQNYCIKMCTDRRVRKTFIPFLMTELCSPDMYAFMSSNVTCR